MKNLFILCAFSMLCSIMNAQDRIVTIEQDTIHCRIISIDSEYINYEQKSTDGYMTGKFIPKKEVAIYFRLGQKSSKRPERPWVLSVNPGGSWMPWLLEDLENVSDVAKKSATGFHVNASGHYLIRKSWGVGLQYSFFYSSVEDTYPIDMYPHYSYYYPIYTITSGKEKQYINYIGASVIFQQFLDKDKKFQLSETISGGMLFYRNENQTSISFPAYSANALVTGKAFGATAGISAEYYVSPSLSVGLEGSFLCGSLKKVDAEMRDIYGNDKIEDEKLGKAIKISRIDYSLALRFHF